MGEVIISAILAKGLSTSAGIRVSDIKDERCRYLKQAYGVAVAGDNRAVAAGGEVVVLAVKPQNLTEVMAELSGKLKPSQLILSIIAGKNIESLCSGLNHRCVVRAMPNTPAQIGEGISVWTARPEVTQWQKEQTASILGAMGKEIYVDDEQYIDMATAISGSGPAYFSLMIEADGKSRAIDSISTEKDVNLGDIPIS